MAFPNLVRRVGPFLLVLAAGIWLWSVAQSFAISTAGRAGPDLWPKLVLLLMLGAAVWGVVEAFFKGQAEDDTSVLIANATRAAGREEDARQDLAENTGLRQPLFAVGGMAAMLGYVAVISYLGYAVSTFLLLVGIMLLAGYGRPVRALLISLVGALVFFFVFQRLVYISLPLGIGPFKDLSLMLMALIGVR